MEETEREWSQTHEFIAPVKKMSRLYFTPKTRETNNYILHKKN